MEYQLSHIYSHFLKSPAKISTMRQYGTPRIFDQRATKLEKAAEAFFIKHPQQQIEGIFDNLIDRIRRFADRRNEIAHSIVRPLHWRGSKNTGIEYGLVPPLFTDRKLDKHHQPKYIYTATELEQFAQAFYGLSEEGARLKMRIARM